MLESLLMSQTLIPILCQSFVPNGNKQQQNSSLLLMLDNDQIVHTDEQNSSLPSMLDNDQGIRIDESNDNTNIVPIF